MMKKLMIATAIVCAAAMSQAATVEWFSGTAYWSGVGNAINFDNGMANPTLETESTIYLFAALAENDWKGFDTAAKIWNAFDADTGKLTVGGTAIAATESQAYEGGEVYFSYAPTLGNGAKDYAIAIITHEGLDGIDAYAASAIAVEGGDMSNPGYNLVGINWGEGGTGNYAVWASAQAVPEPTSGLLLLLGVAGLALRRRRA